MKIGIPKEIKKHEYRVGMIPAHAELYIRAGHTVCMETGAGLGSGFSDEDYVAAGASILQGAKYLEKPFGGRGVLLGGIPGVARGKVLILGGGVVGLNAAKIAIGMGAEVTLLDISAKRLAYLDDLYGSRLQTLHSNRDTLAECLKLSDLVIGAVLIPGAKAPNLVTREMLATMKRGAVLVDVAVDQGGCFETTHPTTHNDPVFIVDGIVHYCVANMPSAVALTSTTALSNVTLSYGLSLASKGWQTALRSDPGLRRGLNVANGRIYNEAVAKSLNRTFETLDDL